MGEKKVKGTWEDTGCYELEAIVSALDQKVKRLEKKWGVKVEIMITIPLNCLPTTRS